MKKAIKIQVIGKVQNVGFRYYTKKKALEFNLNGFVKNVLDGSVYIEAVGEESELEAFLIWCHSGPHWARVDDVIVNDIPNFECSGFKIK